MVQNSIDSKTKKYIMLKNKYKKSVIFTQQLYDNYKQFINALNWNEWFKSHCQLDPLSKKFFITLNSKSDIVN